MEFAEVVVKVEVEVVPAASAGSVPQTKLAAVIARPFGVIVPLMVAVVDAMLEAGVVVVAGPDVNPGATEAVSDPYESGGTFVNEFSTA